MSTYLITPKFTLGSDSFFVQAADYIEACEKAVARCRKEGWSGEWEVYKEEGGLLVSEEPSA